MTKIAFIGAGSLQFTRDLVRDILTFPRLQDATLALMDINAERLDFAQRSVQRIVDLGRYPARVEATLDRAEADAIAGLFGGSVPAAAIKRQCGETCGAAGLLAVIAGVLSLERREVPPTPGFPVGPSGVEVLLTGLSPVPRPFEGPRAVLVNSVDEDGTTSIVLASPPA